VAPASLGLSGLMNGAFGDDVGRDFVVGRLREDAAGDQLILGCVGTAFDDAVNIGVAHAGEGFELGGGCGIDVEESGRGLNGEAEGCCGGEGQNWGNAGDF